MIKQTSYPTNGQIIKHVSDQTVKQSNGQSSTGANQHYKPPAQPLKSKKQNKTMDIDNRLRRRRRSPAPYMRHFVLCCRPNFFPYLGKIWHWKESSDATVIWHLPFPHLNWFRAVRGLRKQLRAHHAGAWNILRGHMPVLVAQVLNGSRRYPRRRDLFGWIRGSTGCCGWHHANREV